MSDTRTDDQYNPDGNDYYYPTSKELRDRLAKRLENQSCKEFLDSVRKELKISETFESLLDEALKKGPKNNKGILFVPNMTNPESSITGKYDQLTLNAQEKDAVPDPKTSAINLSRRLDSYVTLIIHALIHRAGVEGHRNWARAAFSSLSESERTGDPLPERMKNEKQDAFDLRNSDYFMKHLLEKCPNVNVD